MDLAWTFFLLGLSSYGGPATIAQIRGGVLRKGWLEDDQIQESLAFCQVLPGPVGVQLAAHVGWRLRGGLGAFLALSSYTMPAFGLMIALSAAYFRWGQLPSIGAALTGLRAATVGLVLGSVWSVGRAALKDFRSLVIAVAAGACFLLHIHALAVLLGAGLAGVWLLAGNPKPERNHPASTPNPAKAEIALHPPAAAKSTVGRSLFWPAAILLAFAIALQTSGWLGPFYPALGTAMARIDLLAFGGGYTAVALMFDEAVARHAWISKAEFLDGLAFGQITPGPIIVTATFIGYKLGGLVGALFATISVFLPSGVLLVALAPQVARLRPSRSVGGLTRGLLAGFVGMMLFVLWQVGRDGITNTLTLSIALASTAALVRKVSPVGIVLGATAVALALR